MISPDRSLRSSLTMFVSLSAAACSRSGPEVDPNPVVFEDRLIIGETDDKSPLPVPLSQLPTRGECRLWIPEKSAKAQARPGPCAQIEPSAPPESWILFRPSQDPRLVHVRVIDPEQAGRVVQVRVYDAARGTYLGSQQRRTERQ